jgi:hypothetical protein
MLAKLVYTLYALCFSKLRVERAHNVTTFYCVICTKELILIWNTTAKQALKLIP